MKHEEIKELRKVIIAFGKNTLNTSHSELFALRDTLNKCAQSSKFTIQV